MRAARWVPLLSAVVLCLASIAHAIPPSTAAHVDPKAPCYRWPAVDWDGDGVFDRIDRCNDTPKGCVVDAYGCSVDADGDGVCDGIDRCPETTRGQEVDEHGCSSAQRATGHMSAPPAEPPREIAKPLPVPVPAGKTVSESERQLVESGRIRLENVYFETASARLLPESEATLDELGEVLVKFPELKIEVQGHSDTRGSSGLNQRLSQLRAESVRSYLLSKYRLREANITARGYGETQPETRERNEEERLRNRRVEIKALNPEVLPRNVKVQEQR